MEGQQFVRGILEIAGWVPIVIVIPYPLGAILELFVTHSHRDNLLNLPFGFVVDYLWWFGIRNLP